MGSVAGLQRQDRRDLLHSDHAPQFRDFYDARQDARDSRSWDERRGLGVRAVETLRCPVDALLSNQHSDQSRGE
jgi:hypothetical protein